MSKIKKSLITFGNNLSTDHQPIKTGLKTKQFFLTSDLFKQTFEHVSDQIALETKLENLEKENSNKRKVPFNIAITSFVRQTGQVGTNIMMRKKGLI